MAPHKTMFHEAFHIYTFYRLIHLFLLFTNATAFTTCCTWRVYASSRDRCHSISRYPSCMPMSKWLHGKNSSNCVHDNSYYHIHEPAAFISDLKDLLPRSAAHAAITAPKRRSPRARTPCIYALMRLYENLNTAILLQCFLYIYCSFFSTAFWLSMAIHWNGVKGFGIKGIDTERLKRPLQPTFSI